MEIELFTEEAENHEIIELLRQGVKDYNYPHFGSQISAENFTIYFRKKPGNEVIGGICGRLGKYTKVHWAWIDKNYRQQGLGRKLFSQLDTLAKSKGTEFIILDTFEFQAPEFYLKLGYECVGIVPKLIEGFDCHFMRKKL